MGLSRFLKVSYIVPTKGTRHEDSVLFVAQQPLDEIPRKGDEFIHSYQHWEVTNFIRDFDNGDNTAKVLLKKIEPKKEV